MANVELLKHLVTVLKSVEPNRFNLNDWYLRDYMRREYNKGGEADHPECGTVACVAGWAALDPVFQAAGLKADKNSDGTLVMVSMDNPNFGIDNDYRFSLYGGMAMSEVLGITDGEAGATFYPAAYKDVHGEKGLAEAIKKIEALVEKYST